MNVSVIREPSRSLKERFSRSSEAWKEQSDPIFRFWAEGDWWGFPLFSLSASRYFGEGQTLCVYWPLGTVVIAGPKVLDFYSGFCATGQRVSRQMEKTSKSSIWYSVAIRTGRRAALNSRVERTCSAADTQTSGERRCDVGIWSTVCAPSEAKSESNARSMWHRRCGLWLGRVALQAETLDSPRRSQRSIPHKFLDEEHSPCLMAATLPSLAGMLRRRY